MTQTFLDHLLQHSHNIPNAYITLTAMHPDGNRSTPSRHTPLNDTHALHQNLSDLLTANTLGWGAFVSIGLRRAGLSRWQRGRATDVIALPALFVDVDNPSEATYQQLVAFDPSPSAIVFTGGGFHSYWWMDPPITDLKLADRLLRGLSSWLGGDRLSSSAMLRLPGSVNSKPSRGNIVEMLTLNRRGYRPRDFRAYLPVFTAPQTPTQARSPTADPHQLASHFVALGYKQRGEWLVGRCPQAERHKHGDQNPSFGFNTLTGYGNCFVCGTILPKDISTEFGIHPADFGGIFASNSNANFSKKSR